MKFLFSLITICLFSYDSIIGEQIDVSDEILANLKNENDYNNLYAKYLNGICEQKHFYNSNYYILVDIETETEVIEGGLDKRSSLDGIQQVGFFAFLTGKKPVVLIYDTDDEEGIFEYRIKKSCEFYKIEFRLIRFY